jgi:hypothetical protein
MTPGEAAYMKWREILDPQSKPPLIGLVPWESLLPRTRQTWDAIARAAIEASRKG